jgi:hypothetical protein
MDGACTWRESKRAGAPSQLAPTRVVGAGRPLQVLAVRIGQGRAKSGWRPERSDGRAEPALRDQSCAARLGEGKERRWERNKQARVRAGTEE